MPKTKKNKSKEDISIHKDIDSDFTDIEKKIEKTKKELKECKKQNKEYLDGWKRSRADVVNERKQLSILLNTQLEQKLMNCLSEIIPALDSFELAMKNPGNDMDALQKGMGHIHKQLNDSLLRCDIIPVGKIGELFNPNEHNSIEEVEGPKEKEGTVVEVMRVGYKYKEKLIRPAEVKIGSCKDK